MGRSNRANAWDIKTSFPVTGLGGLGHGRKMLLLQWTGTTWWAQKSTERDSVKWASASYSSTGMKQEEEKSHESKSILGEFFWGSVCSARGAQLAQTGYKEYLLIQAGSVPKHLWIQDFSHTSSWTENRPCFKAEFTPKCCRKKSQTALWHLLMEENIFPFYVIWKTDKLYGHEVIPKIS